MIEVKIDASEHDDQLTHYYDYFTNEDRYSGFDKRFIFLTIDGRKPKEDIDKERWISVDYNNIQKSIESVLAKKITDLSLKLALKDYIILLKKHEKMAEKKDELKYIQNTKLIKNNLRTTLLYIVSKQDTPVPYKREIHRGNKVT